MKKLFRALLVCGALSAAGCHHAAARREANQEKLQRHSRELTTAIADVLQLQAASDPNPHGELALTLAREDQRIEGLPARPIPPGELLDPNRKALSRRFDEIGRLLERERLLAGRLMNLGAEHEQLVNARRARWAKWVGSGTLLIGGAIALAVFFPVAIPILGRIFAWSAGKLPGLASALGVVSVKAFDAVVSGIEKSRAPSGPQSLQNQTFGGAGDSLETNLSREMDRAHKQLVRARKAALHL